MNDVHFAGKDMRITVYGFRPGTKQVKICDFVHVILPSSLLLEAYMILLAYFCRDVLWLMQY